MAAPRVRKLITIPEELVTRFEEIYPQQGSLSWFVCSCLEHFVAAHELRPEDITKSAVEAVLQLESKG